jgi:flavin-dependent dehydrogenase
MKKITIAGGGLAGLSLGIGLRLKNVPVQVLESGNYPRHRVCGEFVSGIRKDALEVLGIADLFQGAERPQQTAWFDNERVMFRGMLPEPAYGISRLALDEALARRFVELGGELLTGRRVAGEAEGEGMVWATGRRAASGRNCVPGWVGVKGHYAGLDREADLEVHLGNGAYVGVSGVEGGWVNVTGLFREGLVTGDGGRGELLERAVLAAGLPGFARRLGSARLRDGSVKGVNRFALGWQRGFGSGVRIGDAAAMIAPVTGNGMTMALQGALAAVELLSQWSRGGISWMEAQSTLAAELRCLFSRRLRWAGALQQVLMEGWSRRLCGELLGRGWVSFETLYQKVR